MEFLFGRLDYFLLLTFRTAAFVMFVPVIAQTAENAGYKAFFAVVVSFLLLPVTMTPEWQGPTDVATYGVMIARETFVGLLMAFVVTLAISCVRMAGDLLSMELGLSLASQIDPVTGQETPMIAYIYEIAAVLIFFAFNFHHWIIQGLAMSFDILPVGAFEFSHFTPDAIFSWFRDVFTGALVVAAPVFIVTGILTLGLGLLTRAVPHFNIMQAGYTLRVLIGLGSIGLFFPGFVSATQRLFDEMRESMFVVLQQMV